MSRRKTVFSIHPRPDRMPLADGMGFSGLLESYARMVTLLEHDWRLQNIHGSGGNSL